MALPKLKQDMIYEMEFQQKVKYLYLIGES